MLINMFLIQKQDIDKCNKVLNTISKGLENIYAETQRQGNIFNELNKSIRKAINFGAFGGDVSKTASAGFLNDSIYNQIKKKIIFGTASALSDLFLTTKKLKVAAFVTQLKFADTGFLQDYIYNQVKKKVVIGAVSALSGFFPKNKKLKIAALVTRLYFAKGLFNVPGLLSDYAEARYQKNVAPVKYLATETSQPYKATDALIETFKIKGGVDFETLATFLIGLKNEAAIDDSPVSAILKDLKIDVYDKQGFMKDMATILSELSGALASRSDKEASQIKLALNMDPAIFNFLRNGKFNFDKSYNKYLKTASDEPPNDAEKTREAKENLEYAKGKLFDNLSKPFEWLGFVTTLAQNRARDTASEFILGRQEKGWLPDISGMRIYRSFFDDQLDKDGKKALEPILMKANGTMNAAQQASQSFINQNQSAKTQNNQVNYQNHFNITSNDPMEVMRMIVEKMSEMSRQAEESFDDGVIV